MARIAWKNFRKLNTRPKSLYITPSTKKFLIEMKNISKLLKTLSHIHVSLYVSGGEKKIYIYIKCEDLECNSIFSQ